MVAMISLFKTSSSYLRCMCMASFTFFITGMYDVSEGKAAFIVEGKCRDGERVTLKSFAEHDLDQVLPW